MFRYNNELKADGTIYAILVDNGLDKIDIIYK